jgi:hypothetical protein
MLKGLHEGVPWPAFGPLTTLMLGVNPSVRCSKRLFHTVLALCSKVVCVLLNAWDGSKEWSVDLPEGEEVLAVASGKGWVAVATDTRNLRLFTVAGTQREVFSLPGPVVCVAGSRNRLLTVFHSGMGKLTTKADLKLRIFWDVLPCS